MSDQQRVLSGHGAWRITLEENGIVKFECWDYDDDGNAIAYYSAGSAKEAE